MDDHTHSGVDAPADMHIEGFGILAGRHKEGYTAHIGMASESAELPILLVVADKGGAHIFKRLYPNEMMAQAGAAAQFGPGWKWGDCANHFAWVMTNLRPKGRIAKREAALLDPAPLLAERYKKQDLHVLCLANRIHHDPNGLKVDLAQLYVQAVGKDRVLEFLNIHPSKPKERS